MVAIRRRGPEGVGPRVDGVVVDGEGLVGANEGVTVGFEVVGVAVGAADSGSLGLVVGNNQTNTVFIGEGVGGFAVGATVGVTTGSVMSICDEALDGSSVGNGAGWNDGLDDSSCEGTDVGVLVGIVKDGAELCATEGIVECISVGVKDDA
jgi:hypothetical protein